MAKNDKVNKSIKADKRSKVILGVVITVLALFAIGFFVYISGLLPKVMTGMKVVETVDGSQTTVESISVIETNFHFYQVLNTYGQQGYLDYIGDLDEVADPSTGKTFRQIILDQAATEIMNSVFINRYAEEAGFLPYSAADRVAEISLENISEQAGMSNYGSVDRYLSAMYGTGMSSRLYRQIYARQVLTNEYEQYIRQFVFTPTTEEIMASYDQNPIVYQRVDFNIYFFAAEQDEEGIYDFATAEENANLVATAEDSESFRDLCAEAIGEDEAALAGFVDDQNPTFCEKYTSAQTDYMVEGLTDFLFDEETEAGTTITIPVDNGIYVVLLDDRYVDETPTVSYRACTIYNDAAMEPGAEQADIDAGMAEIVAQAESLIASPMESLAFMQLVKEYSDSSNEIIYGGFTDNITEATYSAYYETAADPTNTDLNAVARAELGQWFFAEGRAHGDTMIYRDPNNQFITIIYFEDVVPQWIYTAQNQLITASVNGWRNDVIGTDGTYAIAYDLVRRLTYSV